MARARLPNGYTYYPQAIYKPKVINPKVEFKDVGKHYIVIANLQGFEAEQVEVQVQAPSMLVMRGLSNVGSFQREFELPADACAEEAQALWSRGFLTITFPKYYLSSTPRKPPSLTVVNFH